MNDLASQYAAYVARRLGTAAEQAPIHRDADADQAAIHHDADAEQPEVGPFSQRTQIWQRFCDGKSLSVIARALGIDRQTAARHVHAIQDELAESDREIHQLALLQAVQSQLAIQAAAMEAYRAEVALEEDYRAACAFDHAQATRTAQTHHPNIHRDWLPPGTPTASSPTNALPPYRAQRARLLAIASQAAWRAALLQGLPARPSASPSPTSTPSPQPPSTPPAPASPAPSAAPTAELAGDPFSAPPAPADPPAAPPAPAPVDPPAAAPGNSAPFSSAGLINSNLAGPLLAQRPASLQPPAPQHAARAGGRLAQRLVESDSTSSMSHNRAAPRCPAGGVRPSLVVHGGSRAENRASAKKLGSGSHAMLLGRHSSPVHRAGDQRHILAAAQCSHAPCPRRY